MHLVEFHSIRIQSIVLQLCAKYLSPLSLFFPGKRKRADSLLTTVQDMLVSEAQQQRQSDACFDSMLHFFQERADREAEERMAVRAELEEASRQQRTLMGGDGQDGGKTRSAEMMLIFNIMSTSCTCI